MNTTTADTPRSGLFLQESDTSEDWSFFYALGVHVE